MHLQSTTLANHRFIENEIALGYQEQWSSWKEWHVDVSKSTTIYSKEGDKEIDPRYEDKLRDYYEYSLPFYKAMKQFCV